MRGIAVDRDDTLCPQTIDFVALLGDDGVLEPAPLERRTDEPSDAAIAADDRVIDE